MQHSTYRRDFFPYALSAFLIGAVGGFSTVLGPAFVADLGLAYNQSAWTALAQAMSSAACAPILGKLADIFGHRKTLLSGLAAFTLGNVLTATAGTLPWMLLARFVVGLGTAAISPVILSCILTRFPPQKVASGFCAYMLISSASVISGPALGGILIDRWGWRQMIWLCVVLCACVSFVCLLWRERSPQKTKSAAAPDLAGALCVFIFFSLALCLPAFGQNYGWASAAFLSVLCAAPIALVALILCERRAADPILPGRFISRKSFLLSILTLFLTQGLMQANMTNLIVFLRYIRPDSSAASGSAVSVLYLGMSLGTVLLGPLAERYEPKHVLSASLLLTGLGCAVLLFFQVDTPLWLAMLSLGLLGLGLGGNATILMKVALCDLPSERAGATSGTYGLFRDLSAPFGVAVLVPLFTNLVTARLSYGAANAAVSAITTLSLVELGCVLAGITTVQFLPKIHSTGEHHEIAE